MRNPTEPIKELPKPGKDILTSEKRSSPRNASAEEWDIKIARMVRCHQDPTSSRDILPPDSPVTEKKPGQGIAQKPEKPIDHPGHSLVAITAIICSTIASTPKADVLIRRASAAGANG